MMVRRSSRNNALLFSETKGGSIMVMTIRSLLPSQKGIGGSVSRRPLRLTKVSRPSCLL